MTEVRSPGAVVAMAARIYFYRTSVINLKPQTSNIQPMDKCTAPENEPYIPAGCQFLNLQILEF